MVRSPRPHPKAIDLEVIRDLAKLLDEAGLSKIEIERDGTRYRIARSEATAHVAAPALSAEIADIRPPIAPSASAVALDHPGVVTSPMVGTAYLAPAPDAQPFVQVGTQVKAGQMLLMVEAMKTMNQIVAPRAGTVIQIIVEDGHSVEAGEPLLVIE